MLVIALVALPVLVTWAVQPDGSRQGLPSLSPEALVAPVREGTLPQFSGTVVAQLAPDAALPASMAAAPGDGLALAQLGAGTHSMRVWHGSAGLDRVALVRPTSEIDLFRAPAGRWIWNTTSRIAVRGQTHRADNLWLAPATPADLARALVSSFGVDTDVSIAGVETVADRSAYGLVLRPTAEDSRIDYVHLAIDGGTLAPLAVQIYARGVTEPVVDVAYARIRFGAQPSGVFRFQPPRDATVQREADQRVVATTLGSAWNSVLGYRVPVAESTASGQNATAGSAGIPAAAAVPPPMPATIQVHGRWGRGRLATSAFMSVLVVTDGRTFAGPVSPQTLYRAASNQAAASAKRPSR
jgi:hypothetical protein